MRLGVQPAESAAWYQLTVTLPGFQTFNARDVNVEANAAIRLDAR
jgi:hypothetical protein